MTKTRTMGRERGREGEVRVIIELQNNERSGNLVLLKVPASRSLHTKAP